MAVTKSELIERIADSQSQLSSKDVELAVKLMVEEMSSSLATGGRIEIRGFGSFTLHYRASRTGRNPKTGNAVDLDGKYVPHFKPGKELRDRVNSSLSNSSHSSQSPTTQKTSSENRASIKTGIAKTPSKSEKDSESSHEPLSSNNSFDF